MSSNDYISPKTALAYLVRFGLSKRAVAKYCDITPMTLYRIQNAPDGFAFRESTVKKMHDAYTRREQEMASDARVRKELGL